MTRVSNKWYTTIYQNSIPTNPIYVLPLSVKFYNQSIGISYPQVLKTEKTIFSPHVDELTIKYMGQSINTVRIKSVDDWSVRLEYMTDAGSMNEINLVKGVPYIYIKSPKNNFEINLLGLSKLESNGNFYSSTKGHVYMIKTDGSKIENPDKLIINNSNELVIALLPNDKLISYFENYQGWNIIDTSHDYIIDNNNLFSNYRYKNSSNSDSLFTIFPHHQDYLSKKIESLGEYKTIRGNLKLVKGFGFSTTNDLFTPSSNFSKAKINQDQVINSLREDISTFIKKGPPASTNYFFGTWLGEGVSLYQLSINYELKTESQDLLEVLDSNLTRALSRYEYNKELNSYISLDPEFGNEKLNDHHFHYGYFIRSAAILVKNNPNLYSKYSSYINEMVADIANLDRSSKRYPYLRNFDIYESHSWADGTGSTPDGNNQESTSEAVNAWYGVYLWSEVTNNPQLRKTSLGLLNSEIIGAKYYWFNYNNMNSDPYKHKIASIVWAGKTDFATWFSPKVNHIYGIQLLPITPASEYLGNFNNFSELLSDWKKSGGSYSAEWSDLFVAWESLYNQASAVSNMNKLVSEKNHTYKSIILNFIYSR